MLVCVLNLQARRALARKEVKRGWILRARRIGAARRKRQRRGKRRWLKCRLSQVGPFLWLLALAHVTRNVANAVPELSRPVSQHWYIARNKMKPTNPNADTNVEEQRQYLFLTFSSEPTCETP